MPGVSPLPSSYGCYGTDFCKSTFTILLTLMVSTHTQLINQKSSQLVNTFFTRMQVLSESVLWNTRKFWFDSKHILKLFTAWKVSKYGVFSGP